MKIYSGAKHNNNTFVGNKSQSVDGYILPLFNGVNHQNDDYYALITLLDEGLNLISE